MTPTIADTIEGYSDLFVDPQYAACLLTSIVSGKYRSDFENAAGDREICLIVHRQMQKVFGIGDWG